MRLPGRGPVIEFTTLASMRGAFPEPQPAFRTVPRWWREMPKDLPPIPTGQGSSIKRRTARACPPFTDAMGAGYVIGLPCALQIETDEAGTPSFAWDSKVFRVLPIGHADEQLSEHSGHSRVFKMATPWSVRTKPGWSVLWTPPVNRASPFEILSAIVEHDGYTSPVNFPFTWRGEPGSRVVLDAGTPLAQAIPFKRSRVQASVRYVDGEEVQALDAAAHACDHRVNGYRALFHRPKSWLMVHNEDR